MISKEFHASRRALYQEILENNSMAFVFAGESRRSGSDASLHSLYKLLLSYGFASPKQYL